MYPPRRSGDSTNKSKGSGYTSPPHKDANKVNKILQNAKRYEQTKDSNKRDYMLEGIMNMKKKQADQQFNNPKIRTTSKQSDSSRGSEKGDNNKQRDIYRNVNTADQQLKYNQQLRRKSSSKSIQNSERELKRAGTGNYRSSDNLHNFQVQQNYRNQQTAMVRESDSKNEKVEGKRYTNPYTNVANVSNGQYTQKQQSNYSAKDNSIPQTQIRQNSSSQYSQSNQYSQNPQYNQESSQSNQKSSSNRYVSSTSQYNQGQSGSSQQYAGDTQNTQNSNNTAQKYNNPTSTSQYSASSYSNQQVSSPRYQDNTQRQTNSQSYYGNQPQLNRASSQSSSQYGAQSNTYSSNTNTNTNANASTNPNVNTNKANQHTTYYSAQQSNQTSKYQPPKQTITATSTVHPGQDISQKVMAQNLQQFNNAQTQEEKKTLAIKSYKDQQYLKKIQSGDIERQQKDLIKMQMEKLTQQAIDMRNKFYKAEDQRVSLMERVKILEQQNNTLRKEGEQNKLKLKNMQFDMDNLRQYKSLSQNQMKDLKSNKEMVYDDMMNKLNELNAQVRKKTFQITKLQRLCSQLQSQLSQKNYEINRVKQIMGKKQEQVLGLHQKQYQLNKLTFAQGRVQSEMKSNLDRIAALEAENHNLKLQNQTIFKQQGQLSRYRKQIQDMFEDIKDLQMQLTEKDKVIVQYKNNTFKDEDKENTKVKMIEQQLETIMRQRGDLMKNYEQKLLQKDKRIQELQLQHYQKSNGSTMKLGGLQAGEVAFEQILQQQLEQVNMLKRQNTGKVNELFTLKIQIQNLKSQLQNQTNKSRLLSLQLQSNQRNAQSVTQSQLRAAKSEIQSLNRRIQTMNSNLESKRRQNQNKDQYIKQYMLGVNKQSDAALLMSQLEKMLASK